MSMRRYLALQIPFVKYIFVHVCVCFIHFVSFRVRSRHHLANPLFS